MTASRAIVGAEVGPGHRPTIGPISRWCRSLVVLRFAERAGLRLFATLAIAAATAACTLTPGSPSPAPVVYVPETAGIVQDRELVGQQMRFRLADGRELTVPANLEYIGRAQPQVGDLLLAGTQPELWMYRATLLQAKPNVTPPGCYRLEGRATANATHVFKIVRDARGDVIIRFSRAADWTDVGFRDGTDMLIGVTTCINAQGEAFEHTW